MSNTVSVSYLGRADTTLAKMTVSMGLRLAMADSSWHDE